MSEKTDYMTIQVPRDPYEDKLERLKALPDRVSNAAVVKWLIDKEELR